MRLILIATLLLFYGVKNSHSQLIKKATPKNSEIESSISDLQKDSATLKKKRNFHGINLEILGRNYYLYSIGYEYKHEIANSKIGFIVDFSYNFRKNKTQNIATKLYTGAGFFYEYGKSIGFRVGLNFGTIIHPGVINGYYDSYHPSSRPYYYMLLPSLDVGPYFETKNKHWQFTPKFTLHYAIAKTDIPTTESSYESEQVVYKNLVPWLGLSIKYNFYLNTLQS